jgi:hypothetical protein
MRAKDLGLSLLFHMDARWSLLLLKKLGLNSSVRQVRSIQVFVQVGVAFRRE